MGGGGTDRDRDVVGLTRITHLCCVSPIKFQCWKSWDVFGILIEIIGCFWNLDWC